MGFGLRLRRRRSAGRTGLIVRLLVAILALAVVGALLLALGPTPPAELAGPRRMIVAFFKWVKPNLSVALASLALAAVAFVYQVRHDRRKGAQDQQTHADERLRVHDRKVLLKRVGQNWIEDVLEQSVHEDNHIPLGLQLAPGMLQRQPPRRRARQNQSLAAGTTVTQVFDTVDRLLILGPPGSGKTTALLELGRDLLKRVDPKSTEPMPVIFSLSSWAQHRPPLTTWLVDELHVSYQIDRRIGQRWIDDREIVPLLDGLDEVAQEARADCIAAINEFLQKHMEALVVCSRTEEYQQLSMKLGLDKAIALQPPTHQQVYDYLETEGVPLADLRAELQIGHELWELLQTPLVLSIVARTYEGRSVTALQTPGTLAERRQRLFAEYIEHMFEWRPLSRRYSKEQAIRWLTWLAGSMRSRSLTEFHLDRLQPDWLPTRAQQRLVFVAPGIAIGLLAGLFWLSLVPVGVPIYGSLLGLFIGLMHGLKEERSIEPAEEVRWSWARARGNAPGRLLGAAFIGLLIVLANGLLGGEWSYGLGLGLLAGFLIFMLTGAGMDDDEKALVVTLMDKRTTPNEGIRRSARHALVIMLGFSLISGLFVGLASLLIWKDSHWALVMGLLLGPLVGLTAGLEAGGLACLQHLSLRMLLVYNRSAPLLYIRFLNDMNVRLLLQRSGSGYLFIHRLLLEQFAESKAKHPQTPDEASEPESDTDQVRLNP